MRTIKLDESCTDAQGYLTGPMVGHDLPDENHEPSSQCWCSPRAQTNGGATLYVHWQKNWSAGVS